MDIIHVSGVVPKILLTGLNEMCPEFRPKCRIKLFYVSGGIVRSARKRWALVEGLKGENCPFEFYGREIRGGPGDLPPPSGLTFDRRRLLDVSGKEIQR